MNDCRLEPHLSSLLFKLVIPPLKTNQQVELLPRHHRGDCFIVAVLNPMWPILLRMRALTRFILTVCRRSTYFTCIFRRRWILLGQSLLDLPFLSTSYLRLVYQFHQVSFLCEVFFVEFDGMHCHPCLYYGISLANVLHGDSVRHRHAISEHRGHVTRLHLWVTSLQTSLQHATLRNVSMRPL
jgi:hypothetical protein